MQAVPSLVGTGTVIAAAAAGLVFAQPVDETTPMRPSSAQLPLDTDRDNSSTAPSTVSRPAARSISYVSAPTAPSGVETSAYPDSKATDYAAASSWPARRPLTASLASSGTPSAAATLPRSTVAVQPTNPNGWSRRHSFVQKGEWMPPPISEVSRDSISSNGSWIRRLSIRPLSQHGGSARSSVVGPDSLSLNFSLGSAAPILSPSSSTPPQPQQPRNKLVKRTTAGQDTSVAPFSRRNSRSQMPTLRRPATSHQRSATLQQVVPPDESAGSPSSAPTRPPFSFDQQVRPSLAIFRVGADTPEPTDLDEQKNVNGSRNGASGGEDQRPQQMGEKRSTTKWKSFFHERVTSAGAARGSSPFSHENSPGGSGQQQYPLPSRTIQSHRGKQPTVYLTYPSVLGTPQPESATATASATYRQSSRPPVVSGAKHKPVEDGEQDGVGFSQDIHSSPEDTPSKKARRSISMHFSSPTSWISKTGSIRRSKRGSDVATSASASNRAYSTSLPSGSGHAGQGTRHVSAPLPVSRQLPTQTQAQLALRSVTTPADSRLRKAVKNAFEQPVHSSQRELGGPTTGRSSPIPASHADARISQRQRNSSSPLPPLSRLSSFNVDLSRLGAGSSSSAALAAAVATTSQRENQIPNRGFATLPRSFPLVPHRRDVSNERPPTLAGSDLDLRGFVSAGEDDDTDFKSDTIFDSVRTAASARVRAVDTPIESMFDESPPSTASNSKTKRLSIQEILGQAWDSDTRIMEEEDEGISTPIRGATTLPSTQRLSSPVSHGYINGDYLEIAIQQSSRISVADHEVDSVRASTSTDTDVEGDGDDDAAADVNDTFAHRIDYSRPSMDDDDDDDNDDDEWARMDENGVTNHLSPPSRFLNNLSRENNSLLYGSSRDNNGHPSYYQHRSALAIISGNGSPETLARHGNLASSERERPRSNLFDWSESTVNLDKIDVDGHSPRPKTVHGKQELDLRNGRPANRKGPAVAHVRSQSVPVAADFAEGPKPATSKFGTWASGPKNPSEDWDDDFDFGTSCSGEIGGEDFGDCDVDSGGGNEAPFARSGRVSSTPFAMVVPASIQATQPTVKAHSGQIRELSLLVNGLKRLCRHARDLDIVDESPALWMEAENIIALASPDEETSDDAAPPAATTSNEGSSRRESVVFDPAGVDDRFLDESFDAGTLASFDDEPLDTVELPRVPATPPSLEISRTGVVRERPSARRRSVFSPEDDIFGGGWPLADKKSPSQAKEHHRPPQQQQRPHTPDRVTTPTETPDSAMIESIMEAMQQQRSASASAPIRKSPVKQTSTSELFFNTNTLQELVKRANSLFHTLSDLVRRAELITQSPAVTPRHDRLNRREDGSPAFTRVFTDPSSPSKRLPKSHSSNSVLARASPSLESPTSNGISQRLQMMTVN
ncbi:hypothetical protein SPI_02209 [Niveomyces insectorum RCEF 264]|uniref:Uncharacterized protein n=1 Tax=Niveomyces insectorum RCEF 264 TaxID=1081102 RepID=A0A162J8R7_9HYPO|nr:hypothetical protein SPI_02209 [Niveomyces insectorum RCEF 264]